MSEHQTATRAVHAGEQPDPTTGASSPALHMASTYVMHEPGGFSINNIDTAGDDVPYIYTRWGNPTTNLLEEKLSALENAESCIAFASGMAATTALYLSLLKQGDHLVVCGVHYPGTAELCHQILPRYGISATSVNPLDPQNVADAITKDTKLVFIETPANPILNVIDIKACAEIAHAHKVPLAVDSTLASPIATRPLDHGADFVVHSLTKYIGGHGDAMGGALLGSNEALAAIKADAGAHFGATISPFNSWLIARGMLSLPARMQSHQNTAQKVAEFLKGHPAVSKVNYPGLPDHPEHEVAKRQMDNFGGMLSFQAKAGFSLATRFANECKIVHYAVSLGHARSLIYYISSDELIETSYKLDKNQEEAFRDRAGDGIYRLAVGLEDPIDLCDELAQVLGN